jgi:hypothetical protein
VSLSESEVLGSNPSGAVMTLSEFLESEVIRNNDKAEIIFDYFEGKPVRLIGFVTDPNLSDFEILEQGYYYYLDLCCVTEEMLND